MRFSILILSLLSLLSASNTIALSINSPQTAQALVQSLFSDNTACTANSSISNCTYTGEATASGLFADAINSGYEIDSGIILGTGDVNNAVGPNLADGQSTNYNSAGDADLNTLSSTGNSRDAVVLSFNFRARGELLNFQYIFASEEYNEFVNSSFNDVFGFFLSEVATPTNKTNLATIGGASVSINSINKNNNGSQFINNDFKDFAGQIAPFDTQYDGFTRMIEIAAPVVSGTEYTLKLAIADVRDSAFDSAVFLRGFSTIPPEIQLLENVTDLPTGSTIDFGSTLENTPLQRTLTIRNLGAAGAADLRISNIQVPAGFSLLNSNIADIPAGTSSNIQIQLDSTNAPSTFQGVLSFTTNDTDENPFTLNLNGTVIAPVANLQINDASNNIFSSGVSSLNFANTTVGTPSSHILTLTNTGNAILTLTSASLPTGYSISGFNFPGSLGVGTSTTLLLSLDANSENTFDGSVIFNNNSPSTPFVFSVSGLVTAALPVIAPVPRTTASIPTLSEWAMILLSVLLLLMGIGQMRKETR